MHYNTKIIYPYLHKNSIKKIFKYLHLILKRLVQPNLPRELINLLFAPSEVVSPFNLSDEAMESEYIINYYREIKENANDSRAIKNIIYPAKKSIKMKT